MLRIVGGAASGCRLVVPRSSAVRPATDRLRESLFAVLAPHLPDCRVLDVFAGSGVLGLEALSRGAAHCAFVENDPAALVALRANLAAVGFPGRHLVLAQDARCAPALPAPVGIAFVDPPFAWFTEAAERAALVKILDDVGRRLLAPGGSIVLRHEDVDEGAAGGVCSDAGLAVRWTRAYGRSIVKALTVLSGAG